ncbi:MULTISPECIES: LysR family transcriptional regulator [Pseudonocardia]|uniref:LysR family transcriptional regulator n=1 Tax=Pseudonocardia TaxID=1847 RepID=UPI001AD61C31|nr:MULTISPECIES: LysR family transcriptional regulator [Pseudonocardia]MBO4238010.1 LysR family transcriptional regulator [Pseudonocardia alni]
MPQLADLDLLLSVASRGSVGKAAQEHRISQPAASTRISAMERRLGLRLLERSPAGSTLTTEGEVLARYARNVIRAADELLEFGSRMGSTEARRLRIAGSPAISEHLIPDWLNHAGSTTDDVLVEVRTGNLETLHRLVLESRVDLAFVDGWCGTGDRTGAAHHDELVTRDICDDRLAVVVGPRHPWAGRRTPVTVAELAGAPLVLRERGSGLRAFTDELLAPHRPSGGQVELPSSSALKLAVATSRRVTVLNVSTVRTEIADGRLHLVAVDHEMPGRPIRATWNRQRGLTGHAEALVEIAAAKGSPPPGPHDDPETGGTPGRDHAGHRAIA